MAAFSLQISRDSLRKAENNQRRFNLRGNRNAQYLVQALRDSVAIKRQIKDQAVARFRNVKQGLIAYNEGREQYIGRLEANVETLRAELQAMRVEMEAQRHAMQAELEAQRQAMQKMQAALEAHGIAI